MKPPLAERFPRLAEIARLDLTRTPTPVIRAENLSQFTHANVFVKREDLTSELYGGNKTRKLAYLLGDARRQGADTLLTAGALGSHHALATAILGREHGFHVHAFLSPQPWTEHVDENLRAHVAVGTELHPVRSMLSAAVQMRLVALDLRRRGHRPYIIPHGGSNSVGTLGYVEAGLELAQQLDRRELPEPQAIYVALGSGGTAVGLAIGLAASGISIPVRAALVTTRFVGNTAYLGRLTRKTVAQLRALEPRFPTIADMAISLIEIDDAWLSIGYGVVNEEVERVSELAARDGLELDPAYTAPTVATLMEDVEEERLKNVLYVHTLSSADLGPLLRRSPTAPGWARAMAGEAR